MNQPKGDLFETLVDIAIVTLAVIGIAILCSAGIAKASYVVYDATQDVTEYAVKMIVVPG